MTIGLVSDAAQLVGLSPSVFTFLLCLFASVPVSYFHRSFSEPTARHLYAFLSGAALCWLAYGGLQGNIHLYIPILVAYFAMCIDKKRCGYIVFATSFAYLVYCHVSNLSGDKWRQGGMDYTGTLMMVTLKVASCAMDYEDASVAEEQAMSHRMYTNRIKERPTLLEFLGYVFCCGSVLVGPVFDFKSYKAFSEKREVWDAERSGKAEPSPFVPALRSLGQALLALFVYQTLNARFPGVYMTTPAFFSLPFVQRWFYMVLSSFSYRWMYYFIWSVAEAAMILSGLGFTGWTTTNGSGSQQCSDPGSHKPGGEGCACQAGGKGEEPEWKRAQNVDIRRVELGWSAAQLPTYWNMAVAKWMRLYVYDRLSNSAGKKGFTTLLATQAVSALWHGLYPGYFLFFLNAACAQHASKALYKLLSAPAQSPTPSSSSPQAAVALPSPSPSPLELRRRLGMALQFFFVHAVIVDYSAVGFILLRADQTFAVWRSMFFVGTVVPLAFSAAMVALGGPAKGRRAPKGEAKEGTIKQE